MFGDLLWDIQEASCCFVENAIIISIFRAITSTADLNVVEQREIEKKPQVAGKTEQEQRAVVSNSSIHARTALGPAQVQALSYCPDVLSNKLTRLYRSIGSFCQL